jgi:hypothetical protein
MVLSILKRKPEFLGETPQSVIRLGRDPNGNGIHLNGSSLRQHMLVLGTSRDDRAEFQLSLMQKAFGAGSGGIYVDTGGDTDVSGRIRAMAARSGHAKDLHVIDLRDDVRDSSLTTGAFNPFEHASPQRIVDIIHRTVEPEGQFVRTFVECMESVAYALCWLRDNKGEYLDGDRILETVQRDRLEVLSRNRDLPDDIRTRLSVFLESITANTLQHLQVKLASTLGCTVWENEAVFSAGRSDIDLTAIRAQRKYLLVLLPPLERRGDSVNARARFVAAAIDAAMADPLYGTSRSSHQFTPGDGKDMPFLCILDNGPYYLSRGTVLVFARARALGISVVVGSGDLEWMDRAGNDPGSLDFFAQLLTTIVLRLESWHLRIDDMLSAAVCARDWQPSVSKERPFASARLHVKGMAHAEFLVLNSGKMLKGYLD